MSNRQQKCSYRKNKVFIFFFFRVECAFFRTEGGGEMHLFALFLNSSLEPHDSGSYSRPCIPSPCYSLGEESLLMLEMVVWSMANDTTDNCLSFSLSFRTSVFPYVSFTLSNYLSYYFSLSFPLCFSLFILSPYLSLACHFLFSLWDSFFFSPLYLWSIFLSIFLLDLCMWSSWRIIRMYPLSANIINNGIVSP